MSKIGLIIKREYLHRVSKKSFIILTLLMPLMMVALVFVPLWLSSIKGSDVRQIAIIDTTGKYAPLFEDVDNYRFIQSDKSLEEYRNSPDKELYAILQITDDLLTNPRAATLYSEKQVPNELSRIVNQTIRAQIEDDKLATFNIPNLKEIIQESKVSFNVQTIKWGEDGKEQISSAAVASVVGIIFTMIVYMFVLMYGAMVMSSVVEEKTNRIVELMVSSVRPFDLMMGKIIGIGFVGLTQILMWGILSVALFTIGGFFYAGSLGTDMATLQQGMQAAQGMGAAAEMQPGAELFAMLSTINFREIGLFFVIFFIGGYMMYASIFAAIGSSVDNADDTSQFMAPITILLVFALYAGIYSMENPDGPLAFWCSMIPFTSPIVMMVRIPFGIPLWEKLLSVVLLYGSFIGAIWLSAKIYRVGILMYGKKPSFKEMIKWLKFK
ncbi:ABC-2 type transport system permease protein [Parabacteroides sp. PFB2-12]|uniref:ABC transporter permease n=1 Tax=unclassified Parabacteroides TaxID=2649774 RepID=UPI0024732881|nr:MULTISPECIES: ABC transporter permease [unclassified Parabacteroides]MDH6342672.1 ABC-2 type transport system permease protein [Parabacteroides sp. PM6-13]MDH6389735.1 ABC-2 type transport system permease protein [Parabacteroides sp. PFB2-12]